jgi:hypothetical protein
MANNSDWEPDIVKNINTNKSSDGIFELLMKIFFRTIIRYCILKMKITKAMRYKRNIG